MTEPITGPSEVVTMRPTTRSASPAISRRDGVGQDSGLGQRRFTRTPSDGSEREGQRRKAAGASGSRLTVPKEQPVRFASRSVYAERPLCVTALRSRTSAEATCETCDGLFCDSAYVLSRLGKPVRVDGPRVTITAIQTAPSRRHRRSRGVGFVPDDGELLDTRRSADAARMRRRSRGRRPRRR
jgi:hypothetical protein